MSFMRPEITAKGALYACDCASENPNFDRARFLAACQPRKE